MKEREGNRMDHDHYSDEYLHAIFARTRTIALVGASANPQRPSHGVMSYLQSHGFRVFPVNPALAGERLLGEPSYASLSDLPDRVDMVDVFRDLQAVPAIVEQAIAIGAPCVWLQLGLRDDALAQRAAAAGVAMVMDRCPKIEHLRLGLAADCFAD